MIDFLVVPELTQKRVINAKVTPPQIKILLSPVRVLNHAPPHMLLRYLINQGVLTVKSINDEFFLS